MENALDLFNHRYKKEQKFSWLEMIDFAEAYASQQPPKETQDELPLEMQHTHLSGS